MNMNRILHALLMVTLSMALALGAWGWMPPQRVAAQTTYTWNQTGTASWIVAGNWTPSRDTPAADDILQFNGGSAVTVTNVPSQTIGQLLVTNNTIVNLQAGTANNILTIAGDEGTDLDVQSSALNMTGANALTIFVGTGATGSISGNMTCSGSASKLNAQDAGAITFNSGSIFTQASGCTGNVFTNSGTPNVIVFSAGSTFVSQAGSNPFGLNAPNSKVVFQTGSLYRHEQTGLPAFSGRTYADFELNASAYNSSSTGGSPCVMDDLTITAANTMNLNLTGGIAIKGDISIVTGTLGFSPASASMVTLSGTSAQTISGNGTLTLGANANIVISNTLGVTLQKDVTVGSNLTVTLGSILDLGTRTLAVGGTLVNNGTLKQTQTVNNATVNFLTISTDKYRGVDIETTNDLGLVTVAIQGNADACTTDPASPAYVKRCFSITPTHNLAATLTLWATDGEMNGINYLSDTAALYRYVTDHWVEQTLVEYGTDTNNYNYVTADVTGFSSFLMGEEGATPTAVTFSGMSVTSPFAVLAVGLLAATGLVVLRKRK